MNVRVRVIQMRKGCAMQTSVSQTIKDSPVLTAVLDALRTAAHAEEVRDRVTPDEVRYRVRLSIRDEGDLFGYPAEYNYLSTCLECLTGDGDNADRLMIEQLLPEPCVIVAIGRLDPDDAGTVPAWPEAMTAEDRKAIEEEVRDLLIKRQLGAELLPDLIEFSGFVGQLAYTRGILVR